jgi:hypothetical protein
MRQLALVPVPIMQLPCSISKMPESNHHPTGPQHIRGPLGSARRRITIREIITKLQSLCTSQSWFYGPQLPRREVAHAERLLTAF